MLYYPHSGDLIFPECGCWLLQEISDAIEKVADVLDADVETYVDEVD
ncbi:hypothetical protein [Halostella salina]|nr:hypothetical protein [Halostella salina]